MLASVVLFFVLLSGAPTQADLARWVQQLGAADAGLRDHAARHLLQAGDDGADALEAAEFDNPEAALRAQDLLSILRQPSAVLRPPLFVARDQKMIIVELLVTNPRPTALAIEPVFLGDPRGKGVKRSKLWEFDLPKGMYGPHLAAGAMLARYEVPSRSDLAIPIGLVDSVAGRDSFRIAMSYRGDSFRLEAHATIRVGRESLSTLRLRAYSPHEELRAEAVTFLRHQLRAATPDAALQQTLRVVARSPYRDLRRGVARALTDYGTKFDPAQTDLLVILAGDRDLTVARQAFSGLAVRGSMEDPPPSLRRLASKLLAHPGDGRSRYLLEMLAAQTTRDRHRFLSSVLETSRAREVHAAVEELLRPEGVRLDRGTNGLIPRSRIEALGR